MICAVWQAVLMGSSRPACLKPGETPRSITDTVAGLKDAASEVQKENDLLKRAGEKVLFKNVDHV